MEKKTNLIEDVEDNKQSSEYLTQIYSEDRRPFTTYPSKLRDYLIKKIKMEIAYRKRLKKAKEEDPFIYK